MNQLRQPGGHYRREFLIPGDTMPAPPDVEECPFRVVDVGIYSDGGVSLSAICASGLGGILRTRIHADHDAIWATGDIASLARALCTDAAPWIRSVLASDADGYAKRRAIEAIPHVAEATQNGLIKKFVAGRVPLHRGLDPTISALHRDALPSGVAKFGKTGSETYIVPADTEASVRTINKASATAWVCAFHNWPAWRAAGLTA